MPALKKLISGFSEFRSVVIFVPPSKKDVKLDKITTYSSLAKSPSDGYQNK